MTISLQQMTLKKLRMRLKHPFATSFGTFRDKEFYLIEAEDENGNVGYGETVAFSIPWYTEETVATNKHIITDFLIPILQENTMEHPDDLSNLFSGIKRNHMAKAGVEGAIWDLYAKQQGISLAEALGGEKKEIDVGVSIGIQPSMEQLLEVIDGYIKEGYKRIKLKIKPGKDIEILRDVRQHFPDLPIMADANSSYTLDDIEHLQQLDDFQLMMIEQPLAHDDIIDHAKLQAAIKTPICLDESIHSVEDTRKAIELGSCEVINIKIGRVGGLTEAKRIHDYCREKNIPVWCGGMLEAGVGRAHNIALTALPQFVLPGDTAGSSSYWEKDIITPEVQVENGTITVPDRPGIGYAIDRETLDAVTVETETFRL